MVTVIVGSLCLSLASIALASTIDLNIPGNGTSGPKMLVYTVSRGRKSLVGLRERGIRLYEQTEDGVKSKVVEQDRTLTGFGLVVLPPNDLVVCYTSWAEGKEPEVVNCGFGEEKQAVLQFGGGYDWTVLQTDHLTSNLYWVDTKRSVMGVTNPENNASTTLFSDCNHQADGFDIDPYLGIIFACDHKVRQVVKRNVDGTGGAEVIQNYEGDCQGLTLDLDSKMVYYVTWNGDSSAYVFRMGYDGNNSQIVLDNSADNCDLFGVKYFEGKLYVIEGDATKAENSGEKIVTIDLKTMLVEEFAAAPPGVYFRSISFLRNRLKKPVSNPCEMDPCPQICLLSRNSATGYKCACGYGYEVLDQGACAVNSSVVLQDPCAANVTYPVQDVNSTDGSIGNANLVIAMMVLCIFLVGVLAAWTAYYVRAKRRNQMMLLSKYELKDFLEGVNREMVTPMTGHEMAQSCPFMQSVSPHDLVIDRTKALGSGEFGIVYQGTLCGSDVAVKQTKYTAATNPEYFRAILSEIKIMAYIGKHPHIVEFKGAEISLLRQGIVYVVVELSPLGNLLSFLREKIAPPKVTTSSSPYVEFMDLEQGMNSPFNLFISWAAQIANGMDYLGTKQVLHGDLAARNVLVFRHNHVKITDFGMSKHLYSYKSYTKSGPAPLPWRWLALESIDKLEFSTETDVWSYGVTLWEIFSYGKVPYPEYQWNQEFVTDLRHGIRLPQPDAATELVYREIKSCWDPDPKLRPSFKDLYRFFSDLIGNAIAACSENPGGINSGSSGYVSEINLIPFTNFTVDPMRQ